MFKAVVSAVLSKGLQNIYHEGKIQYSILFIRLVVRFVIYHDSACGLVMYVGSSWYGWAGS